MSNTEIRAIALTCAEGSGYLYTDKQILDAYYDNCEEAHDKNTCGEDNWQELLIWSTLELEAKQRDLFN